MKRKIIALGLVVAMLVTAVVSGTLAYLTDSDEAVNVFSVGDVNIELTEKGGVYDIAGNLLDDDRCTRNSDNGYTYSGIVPTNRIEKKVTVKNIGESSAYVRVAVVMNNFDKISKATNFFETLYGKNEFEKIDEAYAGLYDGWYMTHYKETDKVALDTNPNSVKRTVNAQSLQAAEYNSGEVIGVDYSYTTYDCNYFNYGNLFKSEAEKAAAKNSYIGRASEGQYSKFLKDYECVYVYYLKLDKGRSVTLFNGFNIPAEFTAEQLEMFNGLKIEIYADAIQTEGFNIDENHKTLSPVEDAELIAINAFTALETAHPLHERRKLTDEWDGTADTALFTNYEDDDEFIITTAEELAGFAKMVDGGNTFEGKTVKLDTDIDLGFTDEKGNPVSFNPIGYGYDIVFKGTFDGQAHTISNLYQNGWSLGYSYGTHGGGLFASVVDATIKNVNIDNAEVVMECVDMGVLVGYSYGNCTYENISVTNSLIANYQRYTGGVVGEVNGTQTFKNVDVSDTVVSSLWGDFDASLGGIIGGKYGDANVTMTDCDVACELNAYNDITSTYQWHAYRRAGMLIGNSEQTVTVDGRTSAAASYLTAENCTVTYGDWANYTYCAFAGTSWPYVRVQAGYSNDAYSNPRYGHPTDANGNKVVDDNHVHNEGEDHNILCVFDQLYGGGQGVYGTPTHDGVTVVYNNK